VQRLPCALCGRESRGFIFDQTIAQAGKGRWKFCSMRCLDGWGILLRGSGGSMIDKTALEKQAIKRARRNFAEALTELKLMSAFQNCTPAQIDQLIEACVDGFQASMQRQAGQQNPLDDEIPF
jgi:hypothetical protein